MSDFQYLTLGVGLVILLERRTFLALWPLLTCSQWVEVITSMLLDEKMQITFTNVTVDLVSRGAGDQSLTDITPCSIHAELIKLAGAGRQTLVYVWRKESRQMCE